MYSDWTLGSFVTTPFKKKNTKIERCMTRIGKKIY